MSLYPKKIEGAPPVPPACEISQLPESGGQNPEIRGKYNLLWSKLGKRGGQHSIAMIFNLKQDSKESITWALEIVLQYCL